MHNDKQAQTAAPRNRRLFILADLSLPVIILALGSIIIRRWGLDLGISGAFFSQGGWQGKEIALLDLIYKYGTLPSLLLALTGLGVFIAGFLQPRLQRLRREALYLALVMAIGPGLLVNAALKDHWGRPRPRNVTAFQGRYAFEEVLQIDPSSPGESFPSGHASMGFYAYVLYFLGRGRKKLVSFLLWSGATLYGAGMGLMRIAQGGHFGSDVLWSGGLIYLVCAAMYYSMRLDHKPGAWLSANLHSLSKATCNVAGGCRSSATQVQITAQAELRQAPASERSRGPRSRG